MDREKRDARRRTRLSWKAMLSRCYNQSDVAYSRYGGRGISVCDRWREGLDAFMSDMGTRPIGTSIDRINNDGNYEPSNCRWATTLEQNRNKGNAKRITANGKTMFATEWQKETGVPWTTILLRIRQGWTHDEAVNLPVRQGHPLRLERARRSMGLGSLILEYRKHRSKGRHATAREILAAIDSGWPRRGP